MNYPQAGPPQPRSGSPLKWILLGCGGLVLLGIAFFAVSGWLLYRSVDRSPAKAEAVAQEILTFEKPEGFKGSFSMSMMGMKSATLMDGDGKPGGSIIMLAEIPAGAQSQEQFEVQYKKGLNQEGQAPEGVERRPAETFKVRGKDVTAQVSLMKSKDGTSRTLHYIITLDGRPGKITMVNITGSEATVDHAWVQKFLDTVK